MSTPTRISKNTHELVEGDIVVNHGMRLLIDQPIQTGKFRPEVRFTEAKILNLDEALAAGQIPKSWIEEGRWTIQGNELAGWSVEVAA